MSKLPKYWEKLWNDPKQKTDLEKSLNLLSHYCGVYKKLSFLPWKFQIGLGRFFSGRIGRDRHHVSSIENRIRLFLNPTADITKIHPQTLLNELKEDLRDKPINPNGDLARIFYVIAGKTKATLNAFENNFQNYYSKIPPKDECHFEDLTLRVNKSGTINYYMIDLFTDYVGYNDYISRQFQKWNRFISGNWNRHHIDTVRKVVDDCIQSGHEKRAFDQIEFLTRLKNELISAGKELNLDGDLAKRIAYAQSQLKEQKQITVDIIDLASINQDILNQQRPSLN